MDTLANARALQAALPELIALRRHLHAHPELSGNEHQTAALVAGELRGLGWRVRGLVPSPIEGGDGNREFLIAATRGDLP